MTRVLFIILLIIHSMIHLVGMKYSSGKLESMFWLIISALFLTTTFYYVRKSNYWWVVGAGAILISQILIFLHLNEAKYGTIINGIVLFKVIIGYGSWKFNKRVGGEIKQLLTQTVHQGLSSDQPYRDRLPSIINKWLNRSGVTNKSGIQNLCLTQKGKMRTAPNGKWMVVNAQQYFNTVNPGFVWLAKVDALPGIYLSGRDKYFQGKGHMLIKALSLITVVDANDKEIDQGAMVRYLAESVWFPLFALDSSLSWKELDATTAEVTMNYKGISAAAKFHFTETGDFKSLEAKRYYSRKEGATLEDWFVEADPTGYKVFGGIRVPAKLSVTWKLKEGNFTWYQLEIEDIKYNLDLNSYNG